MASVSMPISAVEVQNQLNRILASPSFRNSPRLRRFLELAVERTLAGQPDQLKEYVLGRDAFDRGPDYDPRTDSIVRVEAQRLRRKIREYYETHGAKDPVLIVFHAGSYVPEFKRVSNVSSEPGEAAPRPDPRTVAVLPFSNLSPEPEQDYFCDGITEDIINALTRIPELKVIGRTSAFALDQTSHDLRELGARLGAGTVIEGSARKAGDVLRVSVKVMDSDTRQALWSKVFDRQTGDVFSIEDEIARSIAGSLRVTLGSVRPQDHKTPNVEAYSLYLKARQAWNRMSLEGFQSAIDQFSRVISLYPDYALPYAGLADAYAWLALWGAMRPRDASPKAKAAAHEALRLDRDLAAAHTSLGAVLFFIDWDWAEATVHMKRAVALQPSYALGHHVYGGSLLIRRRFEEALPHLIQAVHLDPLSLRTNRILGLAYYLQHQTKEAEKWAKAAIALQPNSAESHYLLARLYLQQGRDHDALNEALTSQNDNPPSPLPFGLLGACLARTGDRDGAMRVLERLAEMTSTQYVDPLATALVHLGLGDNDTALEFLRKSLEERSPFAIFLSVDPLFDEIRADSRFAELVASLKLP